MNIWTIWTSCFICLLWNTCFVAWYGGMLGVSEEWDSEIWGERPGDIDCSAGCCRLSGTVRLANDLIMQHPALLQDRLQGWRAAGVGRWVVTARHITAVTAALTNLRGVQFSLCLHSTQCTTVIGDRDTSLDEDYLNSAVAGGSV